MTEADSLGQNLVVDSGESIIANSGSVTLTIGDNFELASGGTLEASTGAGEYVIFCNIVFVPEDGDPIAHYADGMTTGFTVSG